MRKPGKAMSRCPLLSKPFPWDKVWQENMMRCKTTRVYWGTIRVTGIKSTAGEKQISE